MEDKLISFKSKTITIEQLMKFSGYMEYINFAELINKYVNENLLDPVKASGKNGRSPALFNKYRIVKIENNFQSVCDYAFVSIFIKLKATVYPKRKLQKYLGIPYANQDKNKIEDRLKLLNIMQISTVIPNDTIKAGIPIIVNKGQLNLVFSLFCIVLNT